MNTYCHFCHQRLNKIEGFFGDVCQPCMKKDFLHRNPIAEYWTDIDQGDYACVYKQKGTQPIYCGQITKETPNFLSVDGTRVDRKKFRFKKKYVVWI